MPAPIVLGFIGAFKTAWKVARAIPWWAWLAAGAFTGAYWYGEARFDAGVAAEAGRRDAEQAKAETVVAEYVDHRDTTAEAIADEIDWTAREAVIAARTETATAAERIRYVTRTIEVPVDCPVGLPASVLTEGREAVHRARAAQGPVRTAGDP